jgi:hypothetical protein
MPHRVETARLPGAVCIRFRGFLTVCRLPEWFRVYLNRSDSRGLVKK